MSTMVAEQAMETTMVAEQTMEPNIVYVGTTYLNHSTGQVLPTPANHQAPAGYVMAPVMSYGARSPTYGSYPTYTSALPEVEGSAAAAPAATKLSSKAKKAGCC
ncbi:unnamed protein product [Polarella glacialis]|uniref:Uncharacterized protein n=1 Tax=Polarella glacialis TaxID=89957 RepID=A0A813KXE5_POLGL|nr:unnamed protein product [Polarella glacialis]